MSFLLVSEILASIGFYIGNALIDFFRGAFVAITILHPKHPGPWVFSQSGLIGLAITIPSFLQSIVFAGRGPRIIFVQLIYGCLSVISITSLQYAYGPFARTIFRHTMRAAAFRLPVEEFPWKFIPLEFDPGNYHFLSSASKGAGSTA